MSQQLGLVAGAYFLNSVFGRFHRLSLHGQSVSFGSGLNTLEVCEHFLKLLSGHFGWVHLLHNLVLAFGLQKIVPGLSQDVSQIEGLGLLLSVNVRALRHGRSLRQE